MIRPLPPHASLSSNAAEFLNSKFRSADDLGGTASLFAELRSESDALDRSLEELNEELMSHLNMHSSDSYKIAALFSSARVQLDELRRFSDVGDSIGMGDELAALAKEVARVETVRNYAETALKLDMLVGDVEDAVSSSMNRTLRKLPSPNDSEDKCAAALRALKSAEEVLSSVIKLNPQWTRLVSAVDHRIDRALAILRPQAISDYRALLNSLGWPPPLASLSSSNRDVKESSHVLNPLLAMQGDLKTRFCESFLALCRLQELQRRRKCRQLQRHRTDVSLRESLWVVEELVDPITIACHRHFSKWVDKPEYIFALVSKLTGDYVDSMDDFLQPLVDKSMLSGYSCREEWISAMVCTVSTYLEQEIFPAYVSRLYDELNPDAHNQQARLSLLNLVDLMIAFDKRAQSLAAHSGIIPSLDEDTCLRKVSSLSVFCDRPDWLDLWAEIELSEAFDKLNPELEDERNWMDNRRSVSVHSGEEEDKFPLISSIVIRCLTSVVERCRALPSAMPKSRFVSLTASPIVNKFLDCLLQRCLEAEGLTALTDDDSLTKVAQSVNIALHFESKLKDFCEDIFFLEIIGLDRDYDAPEAAAGSTRNGLFHDEISKLQEFRGEWVDKLSTVVFRGFDALFRDYIKNKRQWQEKRSTETTSTPPPSLSLLEAMDHLRGKLSALERGLNRMDFTRAWRGLAALIDKLFFTSIVLSNAKFHDGGVERLGNDLAVLFGVFRACCCVRPEGFFPKTSDGLKLLKLEKEALSRSRASIDDEIRLSLRDSSGIRHLAALEIDKILKSRIFSI
ncbi:hypothetical protein M569_11680 [Genlisea aurea]|uniref:Uncharacterized protein n=1 Tax=Genlisea aurea TaxID=192259 RepID=S8DTF8_9LAMI|nr:hypothetical protein M569_11680 [Genlisea aurea]